MHLAKLHFKGNFRKQIETYCTIKFKNYLFPLRGEKPSIVPRWKLLCFSTTTRACHPEEGPQTSASTWELLKTAESQGPLHWDPHFNEIKLFVPLEKHCPALPKP